MMEQVVLPADGASARERLRAELARGDAQGATVLPILRHLVSATDVSIFSEEIIARLRAMLADLARALVHAAGPGRTNDADTLAHALLDDAVVLGHLHALALEWQLTERAQADMAVDPLVSPLLQVWLDAEDAEIRRLASLFLAAQARWCQSQRRMELSLDELPSRVRGAALHCAESGLDDAMALAGEGTARLDSAARLLLAGTGADLALDLSQAGASLFLSALALGSGHARDTVALWTRDAPRLALALRAAGASSATVEEQVLVLHGAGALPEGLAQIDPQTAVLLLGQTV